MAANVFVVDDTAHTLQLMMYLLRVHGHQVRGFANAESALAAAVLDDHPDLILMDIQLNGGIDGYEALARLRDDPRLAGIPTIAVTAFAMVGDREHALGSGFAGYLSKPVDPYTFAEQVDQHLPAALRGRPPSPRSGVTEPAQSSPVADDSGGPVVLVVDDLPSNVDLIRSILRPHGYSVTGAVSVAGGLTAARTIRPALILSDLHIGRESGLELRQRALEDPDLAGIPFAFTTASAASLDRIDDTAPVIHRPLDPAAFADVVNRLAHATPEG